MIFFSCHRIKKSSVDSVLSVQQGVMNPAPAASHPNLTTAEEKKQTTLSPYVCP
jgi:hypothetical protein